MPLSWRAYGETSSRRIGPHAETAPGYPADVGAGRPFAEGEDGPSAHVPEGKGEHAGPWVVTLLTFAVLCLCAFRLTRLVVADTITEPLRRRLALKATWLAAMLGCWYCTGFWVSAVVVLGALALGVVRGRVVWFAIPAVSAVVGLLGDR